MSEENGQWYVANRWPGETDEAYLARLERSQHTTNDELKGSKEALELQEKRIELARLSLSDASEVFTNANVILARAVVELQSERLELESEKMKHDAVHTRSLHIHVAISNLTSKMKENRDRNV